MKKNKAQAINLRRQGLSYNEIFKKLGIPKSTLSTWFSGQNFSILVKRRLAKKSVDIWRRNITRYNIDRSKIIKIARSERVDKATKDFNTFSLNELKLLGVALYWAEGGKRGNRFEFTNSDPIIIKIIINFLKMICLIKPEVIKVQINLYAGMDIKKTKNYWRRLTSIPLKNFYKVNIYNNIASQGKRPKNRLAYGTIQLRVYNIELFDKIAGWIKGLGSQALTFHKK